jgi:hypothetical protein
VLTTPRTRPTDTKGGPVDEVRIPPNALPDEVLRTILREALDRYRKELLDDERLLLLDRIRRLRWSLGIVA